MKFRCPLDGKPPITQTYDQHVARAKANGLCWMPKPANECPKGYYFGGIDYGVPIGTALFACESGTVEVRETIGGYGLHVRITHANGFYSICGHMSGTKLKDGQVLQKGDRIGSSGSTGNSTGPHVHWELRKDGTPLDPAPLIDRELNGVEKLRLRFAANFGNVKFDQDFELEPNG